MNKMKNWMVGLTIVGLLAVGLVAVAGNGFGSGSNAASAQTTCNGVGQGIGGQQLGDRPLDGTGYGAGQGHQGQQLGDGTGSGHQYGRGLGSGLGDGTCL